jgi:hypothetical protein
MSSPLLTLTACSVLPPQGADTCGPAKPVPRRAAWFPPLSLTSCSSLPPQGAAPAARLSRFRGAAWLPPLTLTACSVLPPPGAAPAARLSRFRGAAWFPPLTLTACSVLPPQGAAPAARLSRFRSPCSGRCRVGQRSCQCRPQDRLCRTAGGPAPSGGSAVREATSVGAP